MSVNTNVTVPDGDPGPSSDHVHSLPRTTSDLKRNRCGNGNITTGVLDPERGVEGARLRVQVECELG